MRYRPLAYLSAFRCAIAALLERLLARREAPAAIRKIADTTGLRFSARHPPHPEEGRRPVSKDRGARSLT